MLINISESRQVINRATVRFPETACIASRVEREKSEATQLVRDPFLDVSPSASPVRSPATRSCSETCL